MDGELPKVDSCANCGSASSVNQVGKLQWRVVCPDCGELGETKNNAIDAIANWNSPMHSPSLNGPVYDKEKGLWP